MKKLLCALILTTAGCPAPAAVCTHLESRCAANVVQLCNAAGQWEEIDCSAVVADEPFTCQQDDDGVFACLPESLEE